MRAARAEAAVERYSDRGAGPMMSAGGRRRPLPRVAESAIELCARQVSQALLERRRYAAC